ncbi:hypothetical protein GCM10027589_21380 [Actinocorallia lasiicapitis]
MALLDHLSGGVLARPHSTHTELDALPAFLLCVVVAALFAVQAHRSEQRKYYVTVAVFAVGGVLCLIGGATGALEW